MNMDAGGNKHDHEHENARDVERWLDDALSQYGKVEPRPGLEERVLARLAGERVRSSRSLRWWGAFAFSAAVALAFALFSLGRLDWKLVQPTPVTKVAQPTQAVAPTTRGDRSSAGTVPHAGEGPAFVGDSDKTRRGKLVQTSLPDASQRNTPPKLEQFPSPSPLTDQERMLALYVHDFPEKAALVARAQTDLRRRDELEMAAPWPTNAAGSLEQQE